MREAILKIKEDDIRLDQAISLYDESLSRSAAVKLIEDGKVTVNGDIVCEKKQKLVSGDTVIVTVPEPEVLEVKAENIPIEIVYQDDDVAVIDKPKGMVVHPAAGNESGTLVNALMYHMGDSLSSINGIIRPGIVHRIDKDTSGLLVVAKNDIAHRDLAVQFADHSITRAYTALVYDNIKEDEGYVEAPIGRDPKDRQKQAVTDKNSRYAYTGYRVLERFGTATLIEARLKTGRTHQIRVHMAYIKHPLVGDPVYGPKKPRYPADGQMLHAGLLGFRHPGTGEYMEFSSPLPDNFSELLRKLRRERK